MKKGIKSCQKGKFFRCARKPIWLIVLIIRKNDSNCNFKIEVNGQSFEYHSTFTFISRNMDKIVV